MRILLDTNLLIQVPRFDALAGDSSPEFVTSSLCYAELFDGEVSGNPQTRARSALDHARALALYGEGLPFDDRAAEVYRGLSAAVAGVGREARRRRVDVMVAAVAVANGCAVGTRNVGDFRGLEQLVTVVEL